jgi:outer membrane protein OmpA-like peptidoglycan-associated protein
MSLEQAGKKSGVETAPTGDGAAKDAGTPGKHTLVEKLAKPAKSVGELRAAMSSTPALGADIARYFAEGNDDASLNGLLGRAYAVGAAKATETPGAAKSAAPIAEKAGTGAGATLPPARNDTKTLAKGEYKWTYKAADTSSAQLIPEFTPDKTKVDAKNVSFAQTVLNQVGTKKIYAGGTTTNPDLKKSTFEPYEESTKKTRIDHAPSSENDPYYGAEWDAASKKWVKEPGVYSKVGSSVKGTSSSPASMDDTPDDGPVAREGQGNVEIAFETAAVVLETREPLGSLKWGYKIEDKASAPLVLTGATKADCTDAPSAEWGAAMDKFYTAKFDTIIDEFVAGKADLTSAHKTALDTLAAKLKADATLRAELAGASDLKEADPAKISDDRAKAVRDYLVSKGVTAGQCTVVPLGSDWARVETTAGKDEPKNRRVQIWVRK